ncbi:MAG TPA: hypothetical protein VE981_10350 [Planctomycetota bacterium]|nr:hypothetical protein [Planctomycetota bacterium]
MPPPARLRSAAAILLLLARAGSGQEARPPRLDLRVAADGWGEARTADIQALLRSAADELLLRFPGFPLPVIDVSRSMAGPITLYKRGPDGEVQVKLDVEGMLWARFSFQFAHELCHVVCGAEEYANPNQWFEESVCETSSLFVLGRMSETWKTRAPYRNWTEYGPELKKYRDERIEKEGEPLPEGVPFDEWFRGREAALRADPHLRKANLTIAAALLPLFEEAPGHWEALRWLNTVHGHKDRTFSRYLGDWSRSAPENHRDFIRRLAKRLGATVDP